MFLLAAYVQYSPQGPSCCYRGVLYVPYAPLSGDMGDFMSVL
jgi:hypothetical protein